MPTLQELLQQRAALEAEITKQKEDDHKSGLAEIDRVMAERNLSVDDIVAHLRGGGRAKSSGGGERTSRTAGTKVAAKYRDPESGNTWSGRGLQPNWLKELLATGKKLEDFAVDAA